MVYKISRWWQHLGLVLLGIAFLKLFNLWALFYLLLGALGLAFVHSLDGGKKSSILYCSGIIFLSIFVGLNQKILIALMLLLSFLYLKVKYYPISAFYKGFGFPLLFFLPFNEITFEGIIFFIMLSFIATTSEMFHEANHYEEDRVEGKFTTAILFNLKVTKKTRRYFKIFTSCLGILLLIILVVR